MKTTNSKTCLLGMFLLIIIGAISCTSDHPSDDLTALRKSFISLPDSSRPGVYWYFMDGNLSKEGITADLESMKSAGIGNVLFLEVNVGVPRGKIDFLSEEWQTLFAHAVKEAERLGIEFSLGSGPGWAGSGGPWVEAKYSMRHLVGSEILLKGPLNYTDTLPVPQPKTPYFGEGSLTSELRELRNNYYEDVCLLAFPTPEKDIRIKDIDEKALYYRAPYTSVPNVKPYLPTFITYENIPGAAVDPEKMIDLTDKLDANGHLTWDVPAGNWTILRLGMRNNGAITRPAPMPGLGFEADKLDTTAFNTHLDAYLNKLLDKVGEINPASPGGWKMIHIDSWEMGSQNWTDHFREEFLKRRMYDPLKFLPVYTGRIVENVEISERFLWDVRQTAMELVLENHAGHFKNVGKKHGFTLSIEPYDMNPTADLDLGAVADVPNCEFWTDGHGYNSAFSCIEASSIAHVHGRPVVAAEAFTGDHTEAWKMYPESVKNQGDWAFCIGVNKFVYHTFAHQPLDNKYKPGMTMGPYGVHWDRGQTWWPFASAYHEYVTRCQHILRQGKSVADILYLTPEGAPQVFRAPVSALSGTDILPDKRGYNFDGCSPLALIEKADVIDNRIIFPNGTSYSILVLPAIETMTPELLDKIEFLLNKGAVIIGNAPAKSPSLVDYPHCDNTIQEVSRKIWGENTKATNDEVHIKYGKGNLYHGGKYTQLNPDELYPSYEVVADLLDNMSIRQDFTSTSELIRYIHRIVDGADIYFISNKTDSLFNDICTFRSTSGTPELWNPVTGEIKTLSDYKIENGQTYIPLTFDKSQSYFIVFDKSKKPANQNKMTASNLPESKDIMLLNGPWEVNFDTSLGAPGKTNFTELQDWSKHSDEGIKYYSGKAVYNKTFDLPETLEKGTEYYINLGKVKNIAKVYLNGEDLGIIWTSPWEVKITNALKAKDNKLVIEVINLWPNRLIGDEFLPDDGIKGGKWPEWLLNNSERTSGRYTFTTHRYYRKDSPLLESGLLGPVRILQQ